MARFQAAYTLWHPDSDLVHTVITSFELDPADVGTDNPDRLLDAAFDQAYHDKDGFFDIKVERID